MAGKFIAQLIVQGTTVFAKAFVSAYQQAIHNAKAGGGGAAGAASRSLRKTMHTNEALLVLNIEKPELNRKLLDEVYQRQFEKNNPDKGGSFYLQSKIFRAHQSLDLYLKRQEKGLKDEDEDDPLTSKPGANPGSGSGPGGQGGSKE